MAADGGLATRQDGPGNGPSEAGLGRTTGEEDSITGCLGLLAMQSAAPGQGSIPARRGPIPAVGDQLHAGRTNSQWRWTYSQRITTAAVRSPVVAVRATSGGREAKTGSVTDKETDEVGEGTTGRRPGRENKADGCCKAVSNLALIPC
jgi:hypothetical protein